MKKDIETKKGGAVRNKECNIWNTEICNTLEGINSRLDVAEDRISVLENKVEKEHPGRAAKGKKRI